MYLTENLTETLCRQFFVSLQHLFVSLFFPSVCILSSKPFQNNYIHCKIIDHYFNIFFVEIQLAKENLKNVFWAPEFGCPNRYISLRINLDTLLKKIQTKCRINYFSHFVYFCKKGM